MAVLFIVGEFFKVADDAIVEQHVGGAKDEQIGAIDFAVGDVIVVGAIGADAGCVEEFDAVPGVGCGFVGGDVGADVDVAVIGEGGDDGGFSGAVLADEGDAQDGGFADGFGFLAEVVATGLGFGAIAGLEDVIEAIEDVIELGIDFGEVRVF